MHLVTKVEGMGYTRNVYALNMLSTSKIISILFYFYVIEVKYWKQNLPFKPLDEQCILMKLPDCCNLKISLVYLKGKKHKNTTEFCLKVFGKLHILMQTSWKSDSYFWRYCSFIFSKWLPMEAAIWNKH